MISSTKKSFRKPYRALPRAVQRLARKKFRLWLRDPQHHRCIQESRSVLVARVGSDFRTLAIIEGDSASWFWIGSHDKYERLISDR